MEVISGPPLPEGLLQLPNILPTIKSVGGSIKNTRFRYSNKGITNEEMTRSENRQGIMVFRKWGQWPGIQASFDLA
jgi:hypothetical protein